MNSILRKMLLLFFSFMSLCYLFSQENDEDLAERAGRVGEAEFVENETNEKSDIKPENPIKKPLGNEISPIDESSNTATSQKDNASTAKYITLPYGFYVGAKFVINQIDYEEKTIPFVVAATAGFEYEYKIRHFALQPSFDLSFMHYLWTGSIAAHAENENRTAFTIALNAELPFMLNFDIQKWSISFGVSFALLIRGSTLDLGVKADESVGEEGITAREEVLAINKYHWQNGRFFYPALRLKTEYTFENGWKAGVLFSTYLPIFNTWSAKIANTQSGKVPFLHDGFFTLAIVMHPGKKL